MTTTMLVGKNAALFVIHVLVYKSTLNCGGALEPTEYEVLFVYLTRLDLVQFTEGYLGFVGGSIVQPRANVHTAFQKFSMLLSYDNQVT